MILLVDINDSEAASFLDLMKKYSSVSTTTISAPDVALFNEIKQIKKAFKNVEKIKSGKLTGRPVEELLNQL